VYQAAREAARRIFAIIKTVPPEERYSLTDQIRKELASSQSNDRGSVSPPTLWRHSSTRLMKQSAKRTRHNPGLWRPLSSHWRNAFENDRPSWRSL